MGPTREYRLPSGALLKIQIAPFVDSKALYQSILAEARGLSFNSDTSVPALIGQMFCTGFASPMIENALWKCMARCTIDSSKITNDNFEAVENRGDYMPCLVEVMKDNVVPFASRLFAAFKEAQEILEKSQPSKSTMTSSPSSSDSSKAATPPP